MPNATSPKKKTTDLLDWKTAAVAALVFIGAVTFGRGHQLEVARWTQLGGFLLIATVDYLHGRTKAAAGTIGALCWVYSVGVLHGGWRGYVLALAALIYATWAIGAKGSKKRRQSRLQATFRKQGEMHPALARAINAGLRMADKRPGRRGREARARWDDIKVHLPASAKKFGRPVITKHAVHYRFILDSGTAKWDSKGKAKDIATDMHVSEDLVRIFGLGKQRAGLNEVVVYDRLPFAFNAENPAPPAPTEFTLDGIPLGHDGWADTVKLDLLHEDAIHMLVTGASGAGKSSFLRWLIYFWHTIKIHAKRHGVGARIWACDPKAGQGLRASRIAERWSTDDAEAMKMLRDAYAEMQRREREVGEGRGYTGDFLIVFIDEAASIMNKEAAVLVTRIIQRGRSSRVGLIMGVQSARVANVGGGDVLANFPTRIAFRTTSELENRLALGETNDDFRSDQISRSDRGRFIARGLPSHDWVEVQAWEPPPFGPEPEPAVGPATAWPMPMPPAEAWPPSVRPVVRTRPDVPTDQGEQPRTDERTDKPSDTPDPILAALDDIQPMTIPQVVEATGLTRYKVHTTLTEHEKHGRVRRPHGPNKGYVRADTRSA